jgi:hypothetical protein
MATSDQIVVDETARLEVIMQRHERVARVLPIAVLIALWIVVTEMRWVPFPLCFCQHLKISGRQPRI